MMGGMSATFGSRRDTSDMLRAAPLRGVSASSMQVGTEAADKHGTNNQHSYNHCLADRFH